MRYLHNTGSPWLTIFTLGTIQSYNSSNKSAYNHRTVIIFPQSPDQNLSTWQLYWSEEDRQVEILNKQLQHPRIMGSCFANFQVGFQQPNQQENWICLMAI
uniref:Uncharacterized protein n=1 Tax=Micrurus spixii TaxID=129469 RepID=A0A2D4N0H0_9SAUR